MALSENKLINSFVRIKQDMDFLYLELRKIKSQVQVQDKSKISPSPSPRLEGIERDIARIKESISSPSPSPRLVQDKSKSKSNLDLDKVFPKRNYKLKKICKQRIMDLAIKQNIPIPEVKRIIMEELGISKASFYNYMNELMGKGSLSPSLSPKSIKFKQSMGVT